MVEELGNNEDDIDVEDDTSPMSISKEGSQQSQVSHKKRKRNDEDRIVLALDRMFEESGKRMQMVADAIIKDKEDRSDIARELKNMGFSVQDRIKAMNLILEKPHNISVFMSLEEDDRKVYVEDILAASARGST